MFIKDIETVPQSAFKAATWRIFNFIHQANIFMHWFLATKRHPTNAKFCQITPDGQLLPWRPDHQPCWRGEQVFPWTRLCFFMSDFVCKILKAGRHLMIWTACRLAWLPTGLGPRSTTSFNCSMTLVDIIILHAQLSRYLNTLWALKSFSPRFLGTSGRLVWANEAKSQERPMLVPHTWPIICDC